jgi:short-subunit dehydrogenase
MTYALITGASKGIGKAIAIELANRKNNILLVARSAEQLAAVAEEIKRDYNVDCRYLAIDLATTDAADKVVNWCNENSFAINILVNNAGYGISGAFLAHAMYAYQDMMQLNMATPLALILKTVPLLNQHPKAYILNVASTAAYQAVPGLTVYAATKSFVLSASRGIRYELRNTNISVTALSPGATDTNFASRAEITNEKAVGAAEKLNMKPEEVAKIAMDGMFAGKAEIIPGIINKIGAFLTLILPKSILEKGAGSIYSV